MWTASQQYVRGPRGLTRLSVVQNTQTLTTRLTCIEIGIHIRLTHTDVSDHPSGAVNRYLEKALLLHLCEL